MLLKADAAQVEFRAKIFLAQDKVGIKEVLEKFDQHSDNQKRFNLPTRTIAKNFLYRMIFADAFGEQGFRGPAFAYAGDPSFMEASKKVAFWEEVVEKFFDKYQGIYEHSIACIREATETGMVLNPSGRFYPFTPIVKWNGESDWPRTQILNYPVQGLAADFMTEARKEAWKTIPRSDKVLFINTVHDDVEMDVANDMELCYNICILLEKAFAKIPENFEKSYGVKVNVPMAGEVKFGMSLFEESMFKFKPETFEENWRIISANHYRSN